MDTYELDISTLEEKQGGYLLGLTSKIVALAAKVWVPWFP